MNLLFKFFFVVVVVSKTDNQIKPTCSSKIITTSTVLYPWHSSVLYHCVSLNNRLVRATLAGQLLCATPEAAFLHWAR